LRYILHIYYFHPKYRFINGLRAKVNIALGKWERMTCEPGSFQRIFYVCLDVSVPHKVVVKIPRGDNAYSCNFVSSLRSEENFKKYSTIIRGIKQDPWLGRHCAHVVVLQRNGGYTSEFIQGYGMARLRNRLPELEALPKGVREGLAAAIQQLIADLRSYKAQHGKLVGDWAFQNLVYSPENASIINVDSEGFYSFQTPSVENNLAAIEEELTDIYQILEALDSDLPGDIKTVAAFRILDEVRRSGTAYSGGRFLVGYHSMELHGKLFRGQRQCSERLAGVPYDFHGKIVADLGCNCGGMLHAMSKSIKKGYGFDYNPKCVNAAHVVKALNQSSNLEFFNFDLDRDDLTLLPSFTLDQKVDICFLLSVCMWLKRWQEVVLQAVDLSDTLLFESNGTALQQEEQEALLYSCYSTVQLLSDNSPDDPLQSDRKLYLCTGKKSR
jgi:hypothetical protein